MPATQCTAMRTPLLADRFGRVVRGLRISVTDRCNLRCLYCMPEGEIPWFPKKRILTYEEIGRVATILASLGVREIRLTGGEPLVRRDLPVLARMLSRIEGIEDLAVTTNGLLLAEMAEPLLVAGVRRFNVHMDSLEPARVSRMRPHPNRRRRQDPHLPVLPHRDRPRRPSEGGEPGRANRRGSAGRCCGQGGRRLPRLAPVLWGAAAAQDVADRRLSAAVPALRFAVLSFRAPTVTGRTCG